MKPNNQTETSAKSIQQQRTYFFQRAGNLEGAMGDNKEEKAEKTSMPTHFPLNARIKIVNYDDEPHLNGCIGHVRSKTKKSGRVKIVLQDCKETMKIPKECAEVCPLPMRVIGKQAQEYIAARVRMISACDEDQKSTDVSSIEKVGFHRSKRSSEMKGTEGGACTSSMLKLLYDHQSTNPDEPLSFGKIVEDMRQILHSRGYQQTPQLSSSRPMHLTTPWEFVPSKNFSGKRRALIIGIRYKGMPNELPGTQNDCHNMMKYLKRFHGFEDSDFTILMDDDKHTPPTRVNMLKAFRKFALECHPNDAVYFHFAGHGGSVPDESGDETDGMDETLYPMDYLEAGEILDDEVYEEFILRIAGGVTLNAVVDSCHSGSVFDLPFELFGPGKGLDQDFSAVHFPHMGIAKEHRRKMERTKQERGRRQNTVTSPQRTRAKKTVPERTMQQKKESPPRIRVKKTVPEQTVQPKKESPQRIPAKKTAPEQTVQQTKQSPQRTRAKKKVPKEQTVQPTKDSPKRTQAKQKVPREAVQQKNTAVTGPLPLDTKIRLVGLQKQPQLNGRTGVVKSKIRSNGRQKVIINGLPKSFALKPSNMQLL